jgi:hypothetical protein
VALGVLATNDVFDTIADRITNAINSVEDPGTS